MKPFFRRVIARALECQVVRLIKRHQLLVIAVAGSVGKTTTRSHITTLLRHKFRTQSIHHPGYNSEIGLPLSVFEMQVPRLLLNPFSWIWLFIRTELTIRSRYPHNVLVLELGTDHPGEMERYLHYLRPDIGVMTAVTPEHMENFTDLDAVALEELRLVSSSRRFVANYDDIKAHHRHQSIDAHPHHYYYSLTTPSDYGADVTSSDPVAGSVVTFNKGRRPIADDVRLKVFGSEAVKSVLAAVAVADLLGLDETHLRRGLDQIRPVHGRMNVLPGTNGSVILDDTYNSSPAAAITALEALGRTKGRHIAIMGSMNELGSGAPEYHEMVGKAASGVDLLITVGELANKYLGPAAVGAGLDPAKFKPAESPYAAGRFLRLLVGPGDVILAKGSQNGVFTEESVKLLLADRRDAAKLVRQSAGWMRTKAKQFREEGAVA